MNRRTSDGEPPAEDTEVDDQFRGLLGGVRTTLPGASILLSFLLSFPLQAGFENFGSGQRGTYAAALVATTLATLLLIAPSAQARVRDPRSGLRRETSSHVRVGAYCALAGTIALFVGVVASLLLILSVIYSLGVTVVLVAIVTLVGFTTWFGFPLFWTWSDDHPAN